MPNRFQVGGTDPSPDRPTFNLVAGSGITITASDDPTNNASKATIAAGAHATATLTTAYSETTAVYSSIKSLSITTTGGDLWVNVNGMAAISTNAPSTNPAQGQIQLKLNGTVKLHTEFWSIPISVNTTTGANCSFSLSKLFTGLTAGAYTIAVEGRFADGADGTGGVISMDGASPGGQGGYLEIQAVELK